MALAVATTAISAQQAPPPTFRAQVEAIQVDAFVTDRNGNPVPNLRIDDFEILEDGKPQVITSFSEVNIPIDPPPFSPATPRSDVAANGWRHGRLYVIALDETVLITAEMDPSRLDLAEAEGRRRGRVELAAAAVSAEGKVTRGQPATIDLSLRPESYAQAMTNGLRVQSAMTLPPGRYQLRVAGGNAQAARIGSVMYDLDVPDFSKGRLALSGVALSTEGAERTVSREFAAGTPLSLYVEAYDNVDGRDPRTIELKVDLRGGDGQTALSVGDRRTRTTKGPETFSMTVPVDVSAGSYVLHVHATSGEATVSRDIPIGVR